MRGSVYLIRQNYQIVLNLLILVICQIIGMNCYMSLIKLDS